MPRRNRDGDLGSPISIAPILWGSVHSDRARLFLEIDAIAGAQKRRGYGGELRECSDTDPWRKRAKPILIDLDPVAFADLISSRHQIIKV